MSQHLPLVLECHRGWTVIPPRDAALDDLTLLAAPNLFYTGQWKLGWVATGY